MILTERSLILYGLLETETWSLSVADMFELMDLSELSNSNRWYEFIDPNSIDDGLNN